MMRFLSIIFLTLFFVPTTNAQFVQIESRADAEVINPFPKLLISTDRILKKQPTDGPQTLRASVNSLDCVVVDEPRVNIALTVVGDPQNPSSTYQQGRVDYVYSIGTFEVTNAEYSTFLNAVASVSDPHELFKPEMAVNPDGGIRRINCSGRFVYRTRPNMSNKPVNYVTWPNAARFINWLENNQPQGQQVAGITESGTYKLNWGDRRVYYEGPRMSSGHWAFANGDEWVKAAKYDPNEPNRARSHGYWVYATQTNYDPFFGIEGQSSASAVGDFIFPNVRGVNYNYAANWNGTTRGNVTSVGSTQSPSHYGVFDMNGNVAEWSEEIVCMADLCGRQIKGGSYDSNAGNDETHLISGLQVEYAPISNLDPNWPYEAPELFYSGKVGFRVSKFR